MGAGPGTEDDMRACPILMVVGAAIAVLFMTMAEMSV